MTAAPPYDHWKIAFKAAIAARDRGDRAQTAEIFRNIPVWFPDYKNALVVAAGGLRQCGLWDEAVDLLETRLKAIPHSPSVLVALADAYAEVKSYKRAADYLRQYLALDAKNAGMWTHLGQIEGSAGNWSGAEEAYAKAIAGQPLNADAQLGYGDALYQLGRSPEAVTAYRRALLIRPEDTNGLFKLGSILVHQQQAEEAERLLLWVIEREPGHVGAQINLSAALHQKGDTNGAIAAAARAAEIDPKNAAAHGTLGSLLLEAGETQEAVAALRRAEELVPDAILTLMALATAENNLRNTFAAERVLQRVLSLEPGNLEARHLLSAINGEPVRSVPAGYARQLFNWYAAKFDRMLSGSLQYRAPEDAAALLAEARSDRKTFGAYLDLGCGTGLVAEAMSKAFSFTRKVGVDVAEKMIEVSRGKGIYDELIHGEAAEVLAAQPGAFDLITAVELFLYVGDLTRLMPLVAGALAPGGLFVYSIETLEEGRYKLRPTGRFAHTRSYVEALARAAGLKTVVARDVTLRMEQGAGVPGIIGILKR